MGASQDFAETNATFQFPLSIFVHFPMFPLDPHFLPLFRNHVAAPMRLLWNRGAVGGKR